MDGLPFHILEEILFKLDPKSLAMMQCTDRSINSHISDDPYFKTVSTKWGVMGWIPRWYDGKRDLCQSKPSLTTSSSMELDEKEDVDMMTMVNDDDDDDKRVSSLSKVMRLISGISPYAQSLFKKKGKILGKRLMIEEETESNMMMDEPNSSKFLDVERINKRRRVK
ncbi:putative F-box domain-containing protein [Arabidopsis thaliana]